MANPDQLLHTASERAQELGHQLDSTRWKITQRGGSNQCLICGRIVSVTFQPEEIYGTALSAKCDETAFWLRKESGNAQSHTDQHQPAPPSSAANTNSVDASHVVAAAAIQQTSVGATHAQNRKDSRAGVVVLILLIGVIVLAFIFARLAVYRFLYWVMTLWLIAGLVSLAIPLRVLGIKNRTAALVVVIVSVVLMGVFNSPLEKDRQAKLAREKAQVEQAQADAKRRAEAAFNTMSPAAHLMAARSELKLDSAQEKIDDAFHHLDAIPHSAPEARESRMVRSNFLALQRQRDQESAAKILSQSEKALSVQNTDQAGSLLAEVAKLTDLNSATQARIANLRDKINSIDAKRNEEALLEANPLEVAHSTWRLGGFNTVAIWTVTFRNRSDRPVGNIKYHCCPVKSRRESVG